MKVSFLYFLPLYFDYENIKYISEINNNEKELDISNLTKSLIQKKFQGKNKSILPIVLVNPFYNKNSLFNNLHVGIFEKQN